MGRHQRVARGGTDDKTGRTRGERKLCTGPSEIFKKKDSETQNAQSETQPNGEQTMHSLLGHLVLKHFQRPNKIFRPKGILPAKNEDLEQGVS